MLEFRFLAAIFSLAVCACINVPEVEQASPDAGGADSGSIDSGTHTVVSLQTSRLVTNRDVQVDVSIAGPVPEKVELFVNGFSVATLVPPYGLRLSTSAMDEGVHSLVAVATVGGRMFGNVPRELIVDRTSPRIVSHVPMNGARNVSVHQAIWAEFSEPIDPSTVNQESVRLMAGGDVLAAQVVLGSEGTSVVLRPEAPLPVDVDVSVVIESTVADLAGNALQSQQDWEWVAPGYLPLGEPLTASSDGVPSADYPCVQVGGDGMPIVAWSEGAQSETTGAHVKRWNGNAWERLGDVLYVGPKGRFAARCSLTVMQDGAPVVAWSQYLPATGEAEVYVSRWSGGVWRSLGSPVKTVFPSGGVDAITLRAGTTGQLTLMLWERSVSGSQISVWRWAGENWKVLGGALKVNHSWLLASAQFVMDSSGEPFVVWHEMNNVDTNTRRAYARLWDGSFWQDGNMSFSDYPGLLGMDDTGALVLARRARDMSTGGEVSAHVHVWKWDDGVWADMGSPFGGIYPGRTDATARDFALSGAGFFTLVSEPRVEDGWESLYVYRWTAGRWAPVGGTLVASPDSPPLNARFQFAVDAAGTPFLVRSERMGESYDSRLHVYRPNN
ncbi:Ig-like domain-containing protein [Myxococcus xanthus]|uniref:Ig-like domain-containing protein n=1 Tax=Myxococcus xanthus TaxID=34 RepID=UPI0019178073|nr:Ig-like domain-containing protein [Myxococcus xanthus]QQR45042.1 Ig-like domain-containing protein [Myxococcus xanthus]